jgi:hypothetical protein
MLENVTSLMGIHVSVAFTWGLLLTLFKCPYLCFLSELDYMRGKLKSPNSWLISHPVLPVIALHILSIPLSTS